MTKRRKRRKFRPRKLLKRLIVLAILFGFFSGLFFLGRGIYRLAVGWLNRPKPLATFLAEEAVMDDGIVAEAVVLRHEVVVLSDKPGQANLLLEEGAQTKPGQLILEVVDRSLLASIEAEQKKVQDGNMSKADNTAAITDIDTRIIASETKLQNLLLDYHEALRQQAVQTYKGIYTSLDKLAREVVQMRQDRLRLLQSQNVAAERQQQLEERRQQAVSPIYASAAGVVSFCVDGLEQLATPDNVGPNLWSQLQEHKADRVFRIVPESKIEAGQPVCKIAVDQDFCLLVQLPASEVVVDVANWSSASVSSSDLKDGKRLPVDVIDHQGLGDQQLLLQVKSEQLSGAPRFLTVNLHREGDTFCRVPRQAIVMKEQKPTIYVVEGALVKEQLVEILQQEKKHVIVSGIAPGTQVIAKPEGLHDGEDVTDRLRK